MDEPVRWLQSGILWGVTHWEYTRMMLIGLLSYVAGGSVMAPVVVAWWDK